MGFTKLDSGIIDSSIWEEPLATRVVWVTFLAKADRNGFVGASLSGMKRASNVPPEDFNLAVKTLETPDSDSRSKEFEGRRIEKVEGGWQILNYIKYRQFSYSDSKEAIKKRKQRERNKGHSGGTQGDTSRLSRDISASASVLDINRSINKRRIKGVVNERPDMSGQCPDSSASASVYASSSLNIDINKESPLSDIQLLCSLPRPLF